MTLSRFAHLLGLPAHQAEDALHSERAARYVLSRRSFFGVGAAMVAGTVFSFEKPAEHTCLILGKVNSWSNIKIMVNGEELIADTVSITYHPSAPIRSWPRNWKRNAGAATYSASFTQEEAT